MKYVSSETLEPASRLLNMLSLVLGVVSIFVMLSGLGAAAVQGNATRILIGFFIYVGGGICAVASALSAVVAGWRPTPFQFNYGLASWVLVALYGLSIIWYFTVVV